MMVEGSMEKMCAFLGGTTFIQKTNLSDLIGSVHNLLYPAKTNCFSFVKNT